MSFSVKDGIVTLNDEDYGLRSGSTMPDMTAMFKARFAPEPGTQDPELGLTHWQYELLAERIKTFLGTVDLESIIAEAKRE